MDSLNPARFKKITRTGELDKVLRGIQAAKLAGFENIKAKSRELTAYLEFLLRQLTHLNFEIITPQNQTERACQLSVYFHGEGKSLFEYLMKNGVVTDWREPNVIRFAPVPLYTSYEDIYNFGQILKKGIGILHN